MERAPFRVDLTDPVDIKAKLGDGRRILREIEDQLASLDRLQREAEDWRANVDFLASKVPDIAPDIRAETGAAVEVEAKAERPGTLKLVVDVVNREVRKVRAIEVHAVLVREGHDLTPDQVRNALHYAANKANPPLVRAAPGRGMYAPLAYHENGIVLKDVPPTITTVVNGILGREDAAQNEGNGGAGREQTTFGGSLPGR